MKPLHKRQLNFDVNSQVFFGQTKYQGWTIAGHGIQSRQLDMIIQAWTLQLWCKIILEIVSKVDKLDSYRPCLCMTREFRNYILGCFYGFDHGRTMKLQNEKRRVREKVIRRERHKREKKRHQDWKKMENKKILKMLLINSYLK